MTSLAQQRGATVPNYMPVSAAGGEISNSQSVAGNVGKLESPNINGHHQVYVNMPKVSPRPLQPPPPRPLASQARPNSTTFAEIKQKQERRRESTGSGRLMASEAPRSSRYALKINLFFFPFPD